MTYLLFFLVGGVWSVLCLGLGAMWRKGDLPQSIDEVISQKIFPIRKTKKKPKAPSEIDEWKKEQNAAPLDPGF